MNVQVLDISCRSGINQEYAGLKYKEAYPYSCPKPEGNKMFDGGVEWPAPGGRGLTQ